jgi:hypothetical protein
LALFLFFFLVLLGQFSGSRLFFGVTLEFFFRKLGLFVFLTFLLFYVFVPACLTLVGFSFIYFFSFVYFLLYRAGIITTADAGVFDFLNIIKRLCVQVWCSGLFGQVHNYSGGGIASSYSCEVGRLEINKIGFLVRVACADFFKGISWSSSNSAFVNNIGLNRDFTNLAPITNSGRSVFRFHSYFFNNFYALRDLYRVVLYSSGSMLLLRSGANAGNLFCDSPLVSVVARLQLAVVLPPLSCSNPIGKGVSPLLPLMYNFRGDNSNVGVLTLSAWGNFLTNSTNAAFFNIFLSSDVLATRVFTHLYTSLLTVQSDMQSICGSGGLWGDRRFLSHSGSAYHKQLRLYREGFYGFRDQRCASGGGSILNSASPRASISSLAGSNVVSAFTNRTSGVTLWFLANTTSPYYGYFGSGSYYPAQLCYDEDAWWFGGSSFANLGSIGDWWGAHDSSSVGADEEFFF